MSKGRENSINPTIKYIDDCPIDLQEIDYLHTGRYATTLMQAIESAPKGQVFTIGLFGGWGSGKSSIVQTAEKKLNKNIKVVTYDAWQYSGDSFRRTFLQNLYKALKVDDSKLKKRLYEDSSEEIEYNVHLSWANFCICVIAIIFCIVFYFIGKHCLNLNDQTITAIEWLASIASVVGFIFSLLNKCRVSVEQPHLFAPEQFEEYFWDVVKNFKGERLVIVIDNLDRCQPDIAYSQLSDIKTFIGGQYKVDINKSIVFVVPIGDIALNDKIFKESQDGNKDKEEFLRKFFNTSIRIKPYFDMDMHEFARKISVKHGLSLNEDTLYLASREYSTNPRRIIKLFNDLMTESTLYPNIDTKELETPLCASIIMREEYPPLYKLVAESPRILKTDYSVVEKKLQEEFGKEKDFSAEKRFLNYTERIFKSTQTTTLNKIFSNVPTLYEGLSAECFKAIKILDIDKFIMCYENENPSDIENLLEHYVSDALNTNSGLEVFNLFNFLAEIYDKVDLSKIILSLNDKFRSYGYGNIFIDERDNKAIKCCEFVLWMESALKLKDAKKALLDVCKATTPGNQGSSVDLLKAALLKIDNERDLEQLDSAYRLNEEALNIKEKLTELQCKYLVTDKLLHQWITKLNFINDNGYTDAFINYIQHGYVLSDNIWIDIFNKVPSVQTPLQSEQNLNKVIQFLNALMQELETGATFSNDVIKALQKAYKNIISSRNITGSSYNIITRSIGDDSLCEILLDFSYHVYRLTGGQEPCKEIINGLKSKKGSSLLKYFIKLIEGECTLSYIKDDVYSCLNDFSNPDCLKIYKYLCSRKDPESSISKNKIESKYDKLIENIKEVDVQDVIVELANDERYSSKIVQAITSKGAEFINTLSERLLPIAVSAFTKETCKEYKNNFLYLENVIKYGDELQNSLIKDICVENIQNLNSLDDTLKLVLKLKSDKAGKDSIIAALEQAKATSSDKQKIIQDCIDKITPKTKRTKKKAN